jgi:hypothetical protein
MAHRIEAIDKNLIKLAMLDYADEESVDNLKKDLEKHFQGTSPSNPLFILIGADSSGRASQKARREFVELFKDPRLGFIAITQSNPFTRVLATFIAKAAGRSDSMHFFNTEEEGLQWLKEQRQ